MDISGIPLPQAELIATILEGTLYGFSLLMYGATVWVLLSGWSTHRINRIMFVVACLFLWCSTVHLIIDIIRIIEALILYRDTYPGGPTAFLSNVSQWTFVSKNYVYAIQTIIADSVILYRCYMVWHSKLIMIVPIILWCGAGAAGIGAAVQASQVAVFNQTLINWIMAFYATTFVTNMLTTVLLASRIWYIDRKAAQLRGHRTSQVRQILHIVIDSGVLYNVTLVVLWICFSVKSSGQFVVLDMIMPIISITFYMVIIRVGLAIRSNRATHIFPLRCSIPNSSCTDPRSKMHIHIPSPIQKRAENDRRPSMSPRSPVDDENPRSRSEINFDIKEIV